MKNKIETIEEILEKYSFIELKEKISYFNFDKKLKKYIIETYELIKTLKLNNDYNEISKIKKRELNKLILENLEKIEKRIKKINWNMEMFYNYLKKDKNEF